MKKFTGIVIIMALVLMQNVDQTEGFGEFSDRKKLNKKINKYISHALAKNEDPKDQHPCIEHQALSQYVMKNLHTLPVSANSAGVKLITVRSLALKGSTHNLNN